MGDDENWRRELDIGGLSLIDEDDSLLLSSFLDPTSYEFSDSDKDDRGLCLFGDTHDCDEETRVGKEDVLKPSGKCNLRKSLAWDKAFFTNAGVLEPDELSTMIESNHTGERKILPTIQEDVNRSTESISTLQSDCNHETNQEFANAETAPTPTPSMPDSQEKMKRNESLKNPSIRVQRLGKVTKQPVAAKEQNTSISRPRSALGRTKRALVDVNKAKQEKNPILTRGKEPIAPRTPISTSSRSKPLVPFKSSLRSSVVSKSELTSSCSSLESFASVSSSASIKSCLDSVKQKKDQSSRIASHSLANGSTHRNRVQPKVPTVSASRTYRSKLSSNVFSASASVDWSSRSVDWSSRSWQASTPNKMGKGNQKTVPRERGPSVVDKKQTLKLLNNSKDVSLVQDDPKPDKRVAVTNGSALRSASMIKPTRLRVPSPKIGYFDGAKTSVARTPTGSSTGPVSKLAKDGGRSPNEPTASKSKSGKSQPTRPPLIQESTNSKAKVSPVSRPMVSASASSPKLTNKMYSKVSAEEQLKGNQ